MTRRRKPVHWSIANRQHWPKPSLNIRTEKICRCTSTSWRVMPTPSLRLPMRIGAKAVVHHLDHDPVDLARQLGIAVHERFRYALCQMDGNLAILARIWRPKSPKKLGSPVRSCPSATVRLWLADL